MTSPEEWVTPDPAWNASCRQPQHLPVPCRVDDRKRVRGCQSGLMFLVEDNSGKRDWLDSEWFVEYQKNGRFARTVRL